jgi:hypothetical protein
VHWVGRTHHFFQFFDGPAGFIAQAEELVGFAELAEQICYVAGDVGIVQSQFALVTIADSLLKEGFEWMSLS